MKQLIFTCLFLVSLGSSEAALPPLYQSLTEFKSILEDPQLDEKLQSGEGILKIEIDKDGYLITTNRHTLHVERVYEKSHGPGPARYKLFFSNPIPY